MLGGVEKLGSVMPVSGFIVEDVVVSVEGGVVDNVLGRESVECVRSC